MCEVFKKLSQSFTKTWEDVCFGLYNSWGKRAGFSKFHVACSCSDVSAMSGVMEFYK